MAEAQDVDKLTQQIGELDVSENNKIIDIMWDTVLDHENGYANGLAQTTYLVCKIDGVETIIKKNTKEKHAEIYFIEYLQTNSVPEKKLTDLTVYINNSPCYKCANALKEYLTNNKDINFTIYVTHLYNIRRKSCSDGNEDHLFYIPPNSHAATYQGLNDLLSLAENRCKIQAFTEEDWEKLHEVMDLTEDSHRQRMTTYPTTKKNHDRSRKLEDENIRDDLIDLQEN